MDAIINELISKIKGKENLIPKDRALALNNYISAITSRHDVSAEIAIVFCDLLLPYMINDKMISSTDDDCTDYWLNVRNELVLLSDTYKSLK